MNINREKNILKLGQGQRQTDKKYTETETEKHRQKNIYWNRKTQTEKYTETVTDREKHTDCSLGSVKNHLTTCPREREARKDREKETESES